jgi:hypothetical protein
MWARNFFGRGSLAFSRIRCPQMCPMLGRAPSEVRCASRSHARHVGARKAELVHQRRLIGGHGAEGVVQAIGEAMRLRRIAIFAQVGADCREPGCGQERRDPGPHGEVLRKAMEHEDRRATAANHAVGRNPLASPDSWRSNVSNTFIPFSRRHGSQSPGCFPGEQSRGL